MEVRAQDPSHPQGVPGLSVAGDVLTFLEGGVPQATFSRVLAADADADGVMKVMDNCLDASNANQRDTNGDGIGNLCDADLNGACITNPLDLGQFEFVLFTADADADFNGDGIVNPLDPGVLCSRFFDTPGPSYQTLDSRQ